MKRYLVICEETCPSCNGEKRIQVETDTEGSLRKSGILNILSECRSCEGTGVIRKEVDLAEALEGAFD